MNSLFFYGFLAILSLAIPLRIYRYKVLIILGACLAETICIALLYASTFIICTDKSACGVSWASSAIPLLIIAMNIGMIWPILAGYAKQAEKDAKKEIDD